MIEAFRAGRFIPRIIKAWLTGILPYFIFASLVSNDWNKKQFNVKSNKICYLNSHFSNILFERRLVRAYEIRQQIVNNDQLKISILIIIIIDN